MCSPGRTHDPSLSRRTFLLRNNEYQYQCRAAAKERERKRGKSAVFESPAIIDCLRKEEGRFERYPPVDQPKEISKRRTYRPSPRSSQRPRRFSSQLRTTTPAMKQIEGEMQVKPRKYKTLFVTVTIAVKADRSFG